MSPLRAIVYALVAVGYGKRTAKGVRYRILGLE